MKGDAYDRLAELQIDKVAVQKDIHTKQLEDEATVGDRKRTTSRGVGRKR